MRLETKTAFITGGGSGSGRAAAKRFAEEGARSSREISTSTVPRRQSNGSKRWAAMLSLASEEADWITSEALVVDGGFSSC